MIDGSQFGFVGMNMKEYKRLGDIATYINGYAFKPEDRGSIGLPIIRIQDLTGNGYDLGYYEGEYPPKIEINNGDILISWSASLGVYIWNQGKALLNQHIFKVVFDKVEIDKNYFVYAVKHKLQEMVSKTHGATMKHIIKKDFDNTLIPFPTLDKQIEIANILGKVEKLIDDRNDELLYLDNLIKARFVEMFGDPIKNPKEWPVFLIEDVVAKEKNALKAGPFGSDLRKEYYVNSGYKIYGQEQVIRENPFFGDYYISEEKFKQLENCSVQAGDVLISLVGTYGKLLIIPEQFEPGIINPRLMKITFDKTKVNPYYFKYFFQSEALKRALADNTHGGTMDILNLGIVRKLRLPLPPLKFQNDFNVFIKQIDKSKVVYLKAARKYHKQSKVVEMKMSQC